MKLAAIDIGSNAVRMLFNNVFENDKETKFQKESLIRVPLRLGSDSFVNQQISNESEEKLLTTMHSFKQLMEVHEVTQYRACATSAIRNAENGQAICNRIEAATGIKVEILNGAQEAELLYEMNIHQKFDPSDAFYNIDLGGGSTEISVFSNGEFVKSASFPIGTVKSVHELDTEDDWDHMKNWLKSTAEEFGSLDAMGFGGNINKMIKMYRKKGNKYLTYSDIKSANKDVSKRTYHERIMDLNLKPDRADVIVPASLIFKKVMKWGDIEKIYVPKLGIADGLIRKMYDEYQANPQAVEQPVNTGIEG